MWVIDPRILSAFNLLKLIETTDETTTRSPNADLFCPLYLVTNFDRYELQIYSNTLICLESWKDVNLTLILLHNNVSSKTSSALMRSPNPQYKRICLCIRYTKPFPLV